MGVVGAAAAKGVVLGTACAVGWVSGGPVGCGIAMSKVSTAAGAAGLAGLLNPL